jgi:hypothetical protein
MQLVVVLADTILYIHGDHAVVAPVTVLDKVADHLTVEQ